MAAKMTATPMMAKVGLSWDGVTATAQHVVNLLKTEGDTAIDLANNIMKMVAAVTGRDMLGVFAAINATVADANAIADAIKAEFGL